MMMIVVVLLVVMRMVVILAVVMMMDDGGGVNVKVCADGSGGVGDGGDDIGVKDNVGGDDCKGYW